MIWLVIVFALIACILSYCAGYFEGASTARLETMELYNNDEQP
jgi:hypothetical protein